MNLHIFNPGHDEALADGSPYYTHTRAARQLMADLWMLPSVWANPEDIILSYNETHPHVEWENVETIVPTGWDAALVNRLSKLGAPANLLPDEATLRNIRQLSSRETAVMLLGMLHKPEEITSAFLHDWASVEQFSLQHNGAMVKAPWSCSGRGLVHIGPKPDTKQRNRVENMLKKQGAVAVEPYFDRVVDFAMEFYAEEDGTIRFSGLSRFLTDPAGHYLGNIVASDEHILSGLHPYPFESLREELISALQKLLDGRYIGPLGVDMMQIRLGKEQTIVTHPCVEINLRHTMGCTAIALRHMLSDADQSALFRLGTPPQDKKDTARLLCGNKDGIGAWLEQI